MKKGIKIAIFIATSIVVALLVGNTPNRSGVKNQAYGDNISEHSHSHAGYTCPEDEIFSLYNTYETRFNEYGKMFYLWECFGDSDHKFWIKA